MADGNGPATKSDGEQANADRPEAFTRGHSGGDDRAPDPPKKEQDPEDGQGDPSDDQPKTPFYKRPLLMAVIISMAVLAIVGGLIWWLHARNYESTDDAFIDGHIVRVAPRVSGRVLKLNVNDNQWVEPDTVVIEIDPADFEVARLQALAAQTQDEARVEQAQANLAVAQANAEQARADVQVAQANAENAESDLKRFEQLPAQARSKQQLDNALAAGKTTAATLLANQKKASSAQAQAQAAQTAIDAALAEVSSAKQQVVQAELNLRYTKVTAGQSGWVTRRTVEQGNYVQVGQEVLDVVPKDVWVTANFKETQLKLMRINQPVTIHVDAYPDEDLKGHVDSIQAGTGAVFSLLPPENATGNYVKVVQRVPVKIVLDRTVDRLLAPGMSVEPKVRVGG